MAKNNYPVALKAPLALALLQEQGTLDRKARKQLEQHFNEMLRLAMESKNAQDAAAFIYMYTLYKTDATLTAAELMKAMRSPLAPGEELDALDAELRADFLEKSRRIAAYGTGQIMARLEW